MAQEIEDAGIVEALRPDVVADLHADVARRSRLGDRAAGRVDVLQRHLRERLQPARVRRAELDHAVVHALAPRRRLCGIPCIAEHDRRRAHELHVDARFVHPLQAGARVPQPRLDRAEARVALHNVAGAVAVLGEPGSALVRCRGFLPRYAREDVSMDIYLHAAARPGCTVPHDGHLRSDASP
jgi:hypothetical protein